MVDVVVAPTVTKLGPEASGAVLVTGSHGGLYPGRLAVAAGVRAAIFHDAGLGRDEAGVGSLTLLDGLGIAAAAVSHLSARIGDTDDMLARGRISRANGAAQALGVVAGMACVAAADLLKAAAHSRHTIAKGSEVRLVLVRPRRPIVLIDSAAMVDPVADVGAIVVTGSHGGLVGGVPAMALRVEGFAGIYNDAGIGIDEAGVGRLPALDARGIVGLTVSASSARIGEARSTFEDGVISRANRTAAALGAAPGLPLKPLLEAWAGGHS
ncbi:hypothetical protein GCM10011611_45120 [Aliidongia dinghuensis]|uniref:Uncharacterized protein n=1 Tax=Aliidongia dinghuensis TaxID=1867774 RepID=A0A8J2YXY9_9PROT|nr:hypothetical protein [Aliidongia dinghuensis]GGF33862.1 hypothetical protein GCM10011611_45120 [Aliidongia dinghuensis]